MRVAFIGQQRAGKDTAGIVFDEWVRNKFVGAYVHPYSLAAPLKALVKAADGVLSRDRLQQIGTDAIRHSDPDFWVKILRREIIADHFPWAYVTDARFENEVHMLSEQKFHLIGVSAPDEERWLRTGNTVSQEDWAEHERHESEAAARAALLNATYHVRNDGSVDKFRKLLIDLFKELYVQDRTKRT